MQPLNLYLIFSRLGFIIYLFIIELRNLKCWIHFKEWDIFFLIMIFFSSGDYYGHIKLFVYRTKFINIFQLRLKQKKLKNNNNKKQRNHFKENNNKHLRANCHVIKLSKIEIYRKNNKPPYTNQIHFKYTYFKNRKRKKEI